EAVVRVHRVREHAAELEVGDELLGLPHVGFDRLQRRVVAFAAGELEELGGILEARVDLLDSGERLLERAAFLAEVLRLLRVRPDAGILQGAGDLYEAGLLGVVVKDTSGSRPSARRGRGGNGR